MNAEVYSRVAGLASKKCYLGIGEIPWCSFMSFMVKGFLFPILYFSDLPSVLISGGVLGFPIPTMTIWVPHPLRPTNQHIRP
jgi:hypothetical protein